MIENGATTLITWLGGLLLLLLAGAALGRPSAARTPL